MKKPPNVYRYLDARRYLADVYAFRKAKSRAFSYRWFSRRAGLKAPNHLKRVIDGDRNLGPEAAKQYAHALELAGEASRYFLELVRFTQAKDRRERAESYAKLMRFRGYRKAHTIDAQQHAYHSKWYIPAIREFAGSPEFRPNPSWIAEQMLPKITRAQAREALDVLISLGMLSLGDNGAVERGSEVLTTGAETGGLHIVNFHQAMMERAIESVEMVPKPHRDISGVTFTVPESALPELKERIRDFRRELIALERYENPSRVMHIAIQLVPLTQPASYESE